MIDPNLPLDHQGMFDPGNDNDEECECDDLQICKYHEENGLSDDDAPLFDPADDPET